MAVLTCEKLHYRYSVGTPFETAALQDVSFSVEEGEIVGIIGHTGSGKSTLIQHLNGLIEPQSGKVYVGGADIWSKQNRKQIRRVRFQVGLCFQYPEYQIFEEDVYKEIAFGPKQMGLQREEIRRRVFHSMELVGLSRDFAEQSPFDLSGGQKRRVAIASILAMEPKVLILDEPCAGLDPRGRDQILDLIRSYRDRTGATVLFVSHSMEDVARICRRVLVMHQGQVAAYGPVADVYANAEELRQMGLNVPQVTDIFLELRRRGVPCRTDIFTVDDGVREFQRLKREGVCL